MNSNRRRRGGRDLDMNALSIAYSVAETGSGMGASTAAPVVCAIKHASNVFRS